MQRRGFVSVCVGSVMGLFGLRKTDAGVDCYCAPRTTGGSLFPENAIDFGYQPGELQLVLHKSRLRQLPFLRKLYGSDCGGALVIQFSEDEFRKVAKAAIEAMDRHDATLNAGK